MLLVIQRYVAGLHDFIYRKGNKTRYLLSQNMIWIIQVQGFPLYHRLVIGSIRPSQHLGSCWALSTHPQFTLLTWEGATLMVMVFTTHTPAVTDVFVSGRNDVALRPGRRVGSGYRHKGRQTTFRGAPIIFVTPIALELLKLGPNSKRGKWSVDHCGFFQCL